MVSRSMSKVYIYEMEGYAFLSFFFLSLHRITFFLMCIILKKVNTYIFFIFIEHYFVNVTAQESGLTIAGFYYICIRRSDGAIEGNIKFSIKLIIKYKFLELY